VVLIGVWAVIVALAMILYVVLDGITLGVALLFGAFADERDRSILVSTIGPVWDANQTWLLFGGGAIFAAFPVVYAVLSSALYLPLITFIMGLIFRGVAFEFRDEGPRKRLWDRAFFLGSLVAVLSQGLTLGGLLTGIAISGREFAGGPFDWLNPFSVMVGIALVPGYVMLASAYLVLKTTGTIQLRAYTFVRGSTQLVLAFMVLVTAWTPYHYPAVLEHWLNPPRIYFVWTFPLLGLLAAYRLTKGVRKRRENAPLAWAIVLFLSGYLGLAASLYPYAIPPHLKIWDAAARPESLRFTLWGALFVLPLVLAYTSYSYWVFRGKTDETEKYGG
jgi:cytochrome d ubiquinol oxidase subunit II